MLGKRLIKSGAEAATGGANTFASENFNTVLYTGTGSAQRIGGYINRGAVFNGSNTQITIPSSVINPSSAYTISFWINFNDLGNEGIFTNASSTIRVGEIGVNLVNSTNLSVYSCGTGGSNNLDILQGAPSSAFVATTWYHIAIISDRSLSNKAKIYINGTEPTYTFLSASASISLQSDIRLGFSDSRYLNGKMDQFRFFNKAISSSEVTTLYGETHSSTTKSTTDIFSDNSGVALYQFEGNANDTGTQGAYIDSGQSAVFNGVDSYIGLSNTAFHYTTLSISAWVKPKNVTSYHTILNNYESGGSPTNSGFFFRVNNDGTVSFIGYSTSVSGSVTSTQAISANIWTNVAAVITPSSWKIYINGVDVSGSATTTTLEYNSTTPCAIGRADYTGGSSNYFNGNIDDLRVYNDALTAAEVLDIAQNDTGNIPTGNLQAYYKFDNDVTDTQGNFNGTNYDVLFDNKGARPETQYNGTVSNVTYQEVTKFTPDLVWIKERTNASHHALFDSVRGNQYLLSPNQTISEIDQTANPALESFNTNGFTVDQTNTSNYYVNRSSQTYVAWCWKAADTTTTIAANSVGNTIASNVRANTAAGFSIVTYSGNGGSSATIGHGLNSAPELIITKSRGHAAGFPTMAKLSSGSIYGLRLNSSGANDTANGSIFYNNTDPTDLVYTVGSSDEVNDSYNYVSYCFHSVDGYQKIGSYTGNGSSSKFVETGFEPAFVLIKRTDGTNSWAIHDNKRATSNPRNKELFANLTDAESTFTAIDFLSNGFQLKTSNTLYNGSSNNYIYLAIAADPDTTTPTVDDSFDVVTYTGTGSSQTIETDFKPDLAWIKSRSHGTSHELHDSVRGEFSRISSDLNSSASTSANGFVSLTDNGFSLDGAGGGGEVNTSGRDYVAWVWKAGDHDDNLPQINTNGTTDSIVSVNDAAGFSIVKFPVTNTSINVGHGLSAAPDMIIWKNLNTADNWYVYHKDLTSPNTQWLNLNLDSVATTNATYNFSSVTSDTFTTHLFAGSGTNNVVAYCWYSVTGHSSIGSYTGSGATGKIITTGFRPRFVMLKNTAFAGQGWSIWDSQRSSSDPRNLTIFPNDSQSEYTQTNGMNFDDTGFEILNGSNWMNRSGDLFIYMAFK